MMAMLTPAAISMYIPIDENVSIQESIRLPPHLIRLIASIISRYCAKVHEKIMENKR
ncbi:hypothetical protein L479_00171 [Exiguobacterium sp. S17]|nr:hypothetical protein L479_00171 [Exiguobacterium sp. S17]